MTLLYRESPGEDWERIPASDYEDEAELQRLLTRSPDVIPVEDLREGIGPLVTVAREAELGSGFADLLCVDPMGRVVVIEVKLRKNPEIRREVIAQAVSYAAYLEGMEPAEFENDIVKPWLESEYGDEVASLELSAAIAEISGVDVDREVFNAGLSRSLERGSFLILIAVDEPHKQLRHTVAYLNSHADLSIYLVEIGHYRSPDGTRQIISPRILDTQRKSTGRPRSSSFDEIMADVGQTEIEVWSRLQALAEQLGLEVIEKPTTRVLAVAEDVTVVTFSPRWRHVGFELSTMVEVGMTEQAEKMRELLGEIVGHTVSKKHPSVETGALLDHWDKFEQIVPRYIEWRQQAHDMT